MSTATDDAQLAPADQPEQPEQPEQAKRSNAGIRPWAVERNQTLLVAVTMVVIAAAAAGGLVVSRWSTRQDDAFSFARAVDVAAVSTEVRYVRTTTDGDGTITVEGVVDGSLRSERTAVRDAADGDIVLASETVVDIDAARYYVRTGSDPDTLGAWEVVDLAAEAESAGIDVDVLRERLQTAWSLAGRLVGSASTPVGRTIIEGRPAMEYAVVIDVADVANDPLLELAGLADRVAEPPPTVDAVVFVSEDGDIVRIVSAEPTDSDATTVIDLDAFGAGDTVTVPDDAAATDLATIFGTSGSA